MILKLLVFVSNFSFLSHSLIIGDGEYKFTPLEINQNSDSCQKRVNASVARIELGQSTNGFGAFGVCDTKISGSFLGQNNSAGTGFLVSVNPPILLTNRHVLRTALGLGIVNNTPANNANPCASKELHFNFTGLGERVGCKNISFAFDPSFGVDAVFIELDKVPKGANFLKLHKGVASDELVHFADHPNGSDHINFNSCRITSTYQHTCDSISGSSGSPLINSNCKVAGLHFAGGADISGCAQTGTPNLVRLCHAYPKIPETCRNYFNSSSSLTEILPYILSGTMGIRDPSQPFDAKERYTILKKDELNQNHTNSPVE